MAAEKISNRRLPRCVPARNDGWEIAALRCAPLAMTDGEIARARSAPMRMGDAALPPARNDGWECRCATAPLAMTDEDCRAALPPRNDRWGIEVRVLVRTVKRVMPAYKYGCNLLTWIWYTCRINAK